MVTLAAPGDPSLIRDVQKQVGSSFSCSVTPNSHFTRFLYLLVPSSVFSRKKLSCQMRCVAAVPYEHNAQAGRWVL